MLIYNVAIKITDGKFKEKILFDIGRLTHWVDYLLALAVLLLMQGFYSNGLYTKELFKNNSVSLMRSIKSGTVHYTASANANTVFKTRCFFGHSPEKISL